MKSSQKMAMLKAKGGEVWGQEAQREGVFKKAAWSVLSHSEGRHSLCFEARKALHDEVKDPRARL